MSRQSRRRRTEARAAGRASGGTTERGAIDPGEHIYRGFAPDPELKSEGGEEAYIYRDDTLEVPTIVSPRSIMRPAPGEGTPPQLDVAEQVEIESAASLLLEYIASASPRIPMQFGSPYGLGASAGIHILPIFIDELERDFGTDMYYRMMNDAVVSAKIGTMIDGILDRDIQIEPGCEAESDDESAQAKKIRTFATEVADFCKYNLENIEGGIQLVLRQMLEGIPMGYKLAEKVWELRDLKAYGKFPGIKGKALCLAALKPKPQEAVSIVADQYNTVLGYIPRPSGTGLMSGMLYGDLGVRTAEDAQGISTGKINIPDMISPEKVARFTWFPRNGDPRGTSHLRPAYIPWRLKIGLYPAYEAYMARFAQPSAAIELGGQVMPPMASADGKVLTSPVAIVQRLLANLANFQAGGAMVLPVGTAKLLEAAGEGQVYLSAFQLVDDQITVSILHTTLSTGVGKFGTKGLGEVHEDTGDMVYQVGKLFTAQFVRDQLIRDMVYYNYGEAGLAVLPKTSFGETEQQDVAAIGGMFASLLSAGLLFPPQFNDVFRTLHIKPLEQDEMDLLIEQWRASIEQAVVQGQMQTDAMQMQNEGTGLQNNADALQQATGQGEPLSGPQSAGAAPTGATPQAGSRERLMALLRGSGGTSGGSGGSY